MKWGVRCLRVSEGLHCKSSASSGAETQTADAWLSSRRAAASLLLRCHNVRGFAAITASLPRDKTPCAAVDCRAVLCCGRLSCSCLSTRWCSLTWRSSTCLSTTCGSSWQTRPLLPRPPRLMQLRPHQQQRLGRSAAVIGAPGTPPPGATTCSNSSNSNSSSNTRMMQWRQEGLRWDSGSGG